MRKGLGEADIISIFEECWKGFVNEYGVERLSNVYCSEADVKLHFALGLQKRLHPPTCVYVEFPIPFDIMDFLSERDTLGRARRKMKKGEGMVADIVVMDCDGLVPFIIAEVKYQPLIWNYRPIIQAVEGKLRKERKERVKDLLKRTISLLKAWEKSGPAQRLLLDYLKNTDKIIHLIKDFKEEVNEMVHAYLCIIDEIYPNMGQSLEEEIRKYNPPNEFKLRFHHNSVRSWLEEQLSKL